MLSENAMNTVDACPTNGNALLESGDFKGALRVFRQALDQHPHDIISAFNAGIACHRLEQWDSAIGYYTKALEDAPGIFEVLFNLGHALFQNKNPRQAAKMFAKAVIAKPDHADAHYNLGVALERTGKVEKALEAYQQAIRFNPRHAATLNNMGVIHRDRGAIDKALCCFDKALALNADMALAHYNKGITLQKNGQYNAGLTCYRQALRIDPDNAPARWFSMLSLPPIYRTADDVRTHRAKFRRNLQNLIDTTPLETPTQCRMALQGAAVFTTFLLQYQGFEDTDIQRTYGRFVHRLMSACYPQWSHPKPMPPVNGGKIRIGYVSAFMHGHTVGDYLLGWLENHDHNAFEIHGYYLGIQDDPIARRLASACSAFHRLNGDLETVAARIDADRLHLLVYPDIGMSPVSTQLAALKLAPLQCVHFGHPVTTGLPTMDFFLTSDLMEPPDGNDHYTEKMIRLPNLSVYFAAPRMPSNPKPRSVLGIPQDRFVFLSSQSLFKYLPQHDDLYPEIALRVPRSCFVFIGNDCDGATTVFKERLYASFRRYDLQGEYFCQFLPKLDHDDFISLNACADVLLDTLEWSGCHTTLEALAVGLPVVTLPGALMRGRHTFAILKMMGIDDTIAEDKKDYIRIASRLAQDTEFYKQTMHAIAGNRHRVFEDRTVTKGLEDFYRSVLDGSENALRAEAKRDRAGFTESVPFGKTDEETRYLRLLEREPGNPKAAFALGSLYLQCNDGRKALKWLLKVQEQMPDAAAVHNNVGKAYLLIDDLHHAQIAFQRACVLDPQLAEVWFNLADLDQRTGSLDQAVLHYQAAIRANPRMSAAYNNMGNVLRTLKRYPEAIEAFEKVISLEPDLAQGYYNLGSTLRIVEQYPAAMAHLATAVKRQPGSIDAWNNLALTCKNVGDLDRALSYFNKALQLQPDFALAHWNRSFVHFLKDDWTRGWQDFEWRFQVPHWRSIYPHRIVGRRWTGAPMNGQTLLVHDEQGLGDTFQFARYLPWARQRCGRLVFETRLELAPLLENTLGIDELIIRSSQSEPRASFDCYVPLMSLGHIMNVDPRRMPVSEAYICAPKKKVEQWAAHMPSGRTNVGLVWAGRPEHGNDANRSCSLDLFARLFGLPGLCFIGLQKGTAADQARQFSDCGSFSNWGEKLETFADTAGVVHHLDLILTVDTSVAHLAGAMGSNVWVLIPYMPDWRWGMGGTVSPWYPRMRLFRQPRPGDWDTVLELVQKELAHMADDNGLRTCNPPAAIPVNKKAC